MKNKMLLAGVSGTTLMTAYSYAVSKAKDENFKEPELLNFFIERLHNDLKKDNKNKIVGWLLHYSMGFLWSAIYSLLPNKILPKSSLKRDLLFGIACGVTGILIWRWMFRRHPHPPQVRYKQFYTHLFFAHLLFALAVGKSYRALDKLKEDNIPA